MPSEGRKLMRATLTCLGFARVLSEVYAKTVAYFADRLAKEP
jgi:hypothetical protein